MGEYAEMMLDGTCCAQCGDFLGNEGEPEGIPLYCIACGGDENGFLPERTLTRKQRAARNPAKSPKKGE